MIHKLLSRTVLAIPTVLFLLFCTTTSADTLRRVQINIEQAETVAQQFIQSGHDVLEHSILQDSFELIVTTNQLQQLRSNDYNILELERGHPLSEHPDTIIGPNLQEILSDKIMLAPPPTGYKDLNAILQDMRAIAQANPTIAKFVDLTQQYSSPTTVEGRHIYALKISDNVNADEDEPAALVVSNHHAREIVTPELALYAMHQFVDKYSTNPAIAEVVNGYEIWIIPVWNPDGYNHVFTRDNMWRKNRRVFSSGIGVDLNRNYPTGWSSSCGGSTNTNSNTYRGPASASEAETSTMITFSKDRHFFKVIDFHSSGRETLYSYPAGCGTHPFQSWLLQHAQDISNNMRYAGRVRNPSAFGEHYQWQLAHGAHAFLVETARQFQPPYTSAQQEAQQVWPGILKFLQRDVPLSGTVTDATTGAAITNASIKLPGVNFTHGEVNNSNKNGRYHVYAPAGQRTVHFSAPGYVQQEISVTLTDTTGIIRNVQLRNTTTSNSPPSFTSKPINKSDAIVLNAYNNSIANDATDPNVGDTLIFAKISGPNWLSLATNGLLTGTPQNTDTGNNRFQVSVTDQAGLSDTATLNIKVTTQSTGNQLENGVAKIGLNATKNQDLRYTMNVPAGASNIKFVTNNGIGDADLYVRFGAPPTDNAYDCISYRSDNNEICLMTSSGGTYYIRVKAYQNFSGVSLTGSFN